MRPSPFKHLRAQVITENTLGELRYIAGADIATSKDSPKAYAGVVVLSYPTLEVVESVASKTRDFSLHSWSLSVSRKDLCLLKVFEQFDHGARRARSSMGLGFGHPRGIGIPALGAGVREAPASGGAKSVACSAAIKSPTTRKARGRTCGDPQGQIIGAVYVKIQDTPISCVDCHRLDSRRIRILMACTRGVRIPEPTRLAHNFSDRAPRRR